MSTLDTTRLNKPWLLKVLISAVVLIGFGIYGFYDATVAYPARCRKRFVVSPERLGNAGRVTIVASVCRVDEQRVSRFRSAP